jgi:hypothetical protein
VLSKKHRDSHKQRKAKVERLPVLLAMQPLLLATASSKQGLRLASSSRRQKAKAKGAKVVPLLHLLPLQRLPFAFGYATFAFGYATQRQKAKAKGTKVASEMK